jgi:NADH-quinone oxidoreductase subunit G
VTGLVDTLPQPYLDELGAAIDRGEVRTVVSVGEDLMAAGLSATQLAKVSIIHLGTQVCASSVAAAVVIPTLTVFEKAGTMVNQQFRLQRFAKAVAGPVGAFDDLEVLARLITAAGGSAEPSDLAGVWGRLATEVPALRGVSYAAVPETGVVLDSSPWAALPFVEGESLHHRPARAVANV